MANKTVKKIEATKPTLSAQYSTFTRKRKVAAYARVSTAKEEQENSFEAQVSYYTQKIQANPEWVFVEVYSDEGITGTNTKKRDGFNRMIEDALAGKIDLILTKSVSRFARNTVDSLVTIRQLKEKGVEVFFEKEIIYTLDAKGELLLTIMSSLAQEEARSISENTSWGRRKSFADGKVSLGYSNFLGYDKGPDGELVINEEQAKIVRRIYSEFLAGKTPGGIAKGLTADGIETPGHKKVWQASTVLNILKNEKYYGAAILQKEITVSYLTKEKRPNTGELPMYYIEKDHEPIVSPETFQMVQEEMRRRREAGSNMQCVSIFSSRIICGDCGGYYGRKIWHSSTKYTAWHWHCNAKFQKRKYCETPTLKEESLEETFVEVFNSLIADKDEIVENYRLCIDAVTDDSEYRRQLGDLNNGCGEVQTLIRSLLMTYSRQDTADDIHEKLKEYGSYLTRYSHELSGGQRQRVGIARALILEPDFVVCDEAVSSIDFALKKQILKLLVDLKKKNGTTYLFISHDMAAVKAVCDRIMVMYLVNILEILPSANAEVIHPYTQALMAATLEPDPTVRREKKVLFKEDGAQTIPKAGCVFQSRCLYARDKCTCQRPELEEVSDGHFVACHYMKKKKDTEEEK